MRYFEYTKGNSNKFWEIHDYWNEDRMNVQVRYGKIGTEGRTIRHYYAKFHAGSKLVDKLVAQKLKKGYVERKFKVKKVIYNKKTNVNLTMKQKKSKKMRGKTNISGGSGAASFEEIMGLVNEACQQKTAGHKSMPDVPGQHITNICDNKNQQINILKATSYHTYPCSNKRVGLELLIDECKGDPMLLRAMHMYGESCVLAVDKTDTEPNDKVYVIYHGFALKNGPGDLGQKFSSDRHPFIIGDKLYIKHGRFPYHEREANESTLGIITGFKQVFMTFSDLKITEDDIIKEFKKNKPTPESSSKSGMYVLEITYKGDSDSTLSTPYSYSSITNDYITKLKQYIEPTGAKLTDQDLINLKNDIRAFAPASVYTKNTDRYERLSELEKQNFKPRGGSRMKYKKKEKKSKRRKK